MGKNRNQTTTGTSGPDATTAGWIDNYRRMANDRYGNLNQTPTTGPLAEYGKAASSMAAQLPAGMERGLGGIDAYTNPHESSVVAGTQADFDRQRAMASRSGADQATRAGAFGGSRQAVLQAGLLGNVNRDESSTLARIRQGGFDSATGNLMADRNRAAMIGSQGAQGLLGYGQYLDSRSADALGGIERGLGYGGREHRDVTQLPYNDFQDVLGLGISAAGLFA